MRAGARVASWTLVVLLLSAAVAPRSEGATTTDTRSEGAKQAVVEEMSRQPLELFARRDLRDLELFLQAREGVSPMPESVRELEVQPRTGPGGLGLPTEAILIQGLIKYLSDRTQKELALVYQGELRKRLEASKFKCLFPGSRLALDQLEKSGSQLGLHSLALAFGSDMEHVSTRLFATECDEVYPTSARPARRWFRCGLQIYDRARSGMGPVEALVVLSDPADFPAQPGDELRPWLAALGIIASECQARPGLLRDEVTPQAVDELVRAVIARLRRDFDVDPAGAEVVAKGSARLKGAFEHLRQLEKRIKDTARPNPTDTAAVRAALDQLLGDVAATIGMVASQPNVLGKGDTSKAFLMLECAVELERAIVAREWITAAERLTFALYSDGDVPDRGFIRFVQFSASLASCKTSDEVAQVLNSATLPAGSYRAKRRNEEDVKAGWWAGLSAYFGPGFAFESREGEPLDNSGHSVGFFAPIGVECSHGSNVGPVKSISLLGSAIDVGNLMQAHIGSENGIENAESIRFQDIFCPGLFLTFGLTPRLPLTLGVGYEVAPSLRVNAATEDRITVQRLSVFLGLDMPLVRF